MHSLVQSQRDELQSHKLQLIIQNLFTICFWKWMISSMWHLTRMPYYGPSTIEWIMETHTFSQILDMNILQYHLVPRSCHTMYAFKDFKLDFRLKSWSFSSTKIQGILRSTLTQNSSKSSKFDVNCTHLLIFFNRPY